MELALSPSSLTPHTHTTAPLLLRSAKNLAPQAPVPQAQAPPTPPTPAQQSQVATAIAQAHAGLMREGAAGGPARAGRRPRRPNCQQHQAFSFTSHAPGISC